jgi:hypothetical protein
MQPPRLVAGQVQQRFELGDGIGRLIWARSATRETDPAQALGKPRVAAAPFLWGHQDFDCFDE